MDQNILDSVNKYYTQKILDHGVSPSGVDWKNFESQELRFRELCRVIEPGTDFSVLDWGCGYGAMLAYLSKHFEHFSYKGYDISEEMLKNARGHNEAYGNASWGSSLGDDEMHDYTILSGIFNVKQGVSDEAWQQYVLDTLDKVNKHSRKGFAFNVLTSYSDKEYMRDDLYYADPCFFFDYCKRHYSKYVAVLHDYPLYEFTLWVKK